MNMMSRSFEAQSPRLTPRAVPIASRLIGLVGPLLFVTLLVQAFERQGVGSWSVGIAYILYDTALLAFTAWKILPLRRPLPPLPQSTRRPSMAVIVAAYNEAPVLGVTIDALAGQSDPPDLILLADDGSSDDSAEVLRRLYGLEAPPCGEMSGPSPGQPTLLWLRLPRGGKARALNEAMLRIDADLVLTIDADTLLAPGALAAMREAFAAEPELVAATGVLAPICGPQPMARLFQWFQGYEYVRNFLSRYAWMRMDSLLLISGAFAGFRREAVVEVGGFDPDCMVEDYELIHRLLRHAYDTGQDWRTRVIGRALASTDAPASPMAFLRQRRRWFGGFLQTQRWNRDIVGNRRYGTLGLFHLPVKALDTLQPIYGLAAFAILIGLVVTGRFRIALPILIIMIAKIAVDLTFHLWSLGLYKRWTGQTEGLRIGPALLASFAEPFSFQLLRHAGAAWGWIAFLSGRENWGHQTRTAITPSR
ncbi:glycosyltransferase family 2 protein [Sphingomonas sp. CGMCC 1.13654]|uniref:Glycosyltransferase family 2 protein n=1 Tax=Sphingomonas chungangi TaxID=2683589 RepID=A0A838LAM3_9SPHN|nr:glycosyltransferase family 2 protein [Sphingomonas chungangi]MBA2936254.1 glycosyltransferase family 2 protein [Sphingomonas chungangi]MVW55639.1 glycosyltransferase [Sphingomonas chungangi]